MINLNRVDIEEQTIIISNFTCRRLLVSNHNKHINQPGVLQGLDTLYCIVHIQSRFVCIMR